MIKKTYQSPEIDVVKISAVVLDTIQTSIGGSDGPPEWGDAQAPTHGDADWDDYEE